MRNSLSGRSMICLPVLVLAFGMQSPAMAQTVTGTVDATMTLIPACEVNGDTGSTSVDFGTLDFGTQSTFFNSATSQIDGGSGSISVRCTPGYDGTLTIVSGQNDAAVAGGGRALANGSTYVPYDIYSDSGFSSVLDNGSTLSVTGDGDVQTVDIYGKALGASGLTPGTYTDTISVTLAF